MLGLNFYPYKIYFFTDYKFKYVLMNLIRSVPWSDGTSTSHASISISILNRLFYLSSKR